MKKYILPEDPDNRQVLLLLDETDIQSFSYEDGASKLLADTNCAVLQVPYDGSNEIVEELKKRHLYRRGSILLQSPYESNKYEEISISREVFPLDKHMYFSEICGWLGAKKVTVKQIERRSNRRDRETKTEVKAAKFANGNFDTKDTQLNKMCRSLTLCDESEGSEPNLEKALEIARKTSLNYDVAIMSLINMRKNTYNKIIKRELELAISNETERIIDIVFNLKVPAYVNLDFNYKEVIKTRSEFILTMSVEF